MWLHCAQQQIPIRFRCRKQIKRYARARSCEFASVRAHTHSIRSARHPRRPQTRTLYFAVKLLPPRYIIEFPCTEQRCTAIPAPITANSARSERSVGSTGVHVSPLKSYIHHIISLVNFISYCVMCAVRLFQITHTHCSGTNTRLHTTPPPPRIFMIFH